MTTYLTRFKLKFIQDAFQKKATSHLACKDVTIHEAVSSKIVLESDFHVYFCWFQIFLFGCFAFLNSFARFLMIFFRSDVFWRSILIPWESCSYSSLKISKSSHAFIEDSKGTNVYSKGSLRFQIYGGWRYFQIYFSSFEYPNYSFSQF